MCIENSKRLLKTSVQVMQYEDFATANSLTILALEESVKGFLFYTKTIDDSQTFAGLHSIINDHGRKHHFVMQRFDKMFDIFLKLLDEFIRLVKLGLSNKPNDEHGIKLLNAFNKVKEQLNVIDSKKESIRKWLKKANDLKSRGFYVDFVNNKWNTPTDISFDQFEEIIYFGTTFLSFVSLLDKSEDIEHYINRITSKQHSDTTLNKQE